MYVRVTQYKMKPESVETAKALLIQMKTQIMTIPGMIRFTNAINADGSGCVVALVESKAVADANIGRIAEAWASFADHLAGPPTAQGFDVFAEWSN